jgi:succinoglycan biosynthesis transport protein ExoP
MSQANLVWAQIRPYCLALRTEYKVWLIPTLLFTWAAMGYALIVPRNWKASQAILVRDEAIGNQNRQGQFDSIDRMKLFQETILEVARNRVVVESVLRKIGPPLAHSPDEPWPTDSAIASLQQSISVSAPKGSEFGRTEMIFLSVTDRSAEEAKVRAKILCDVLDVHLAELRDARAQSIVSELERTLQLAEIDLNRATADLEKMEREIGPDLGELRLLNEIGSGDSNLRTGTNQIKQELRQAEIQSESLKQLNDLLRAASQNPDSLLATPSRLLDAQPALKRLKEGLVDAQLRSASLRGRLSDEHPTVLSAKRTEEKIRGDLHAELETAINGVQADLLANKAQIDRLSRQLTEVQQRLEGLSGLRARYQNLIAEVRRRTDTVDQVKKNLSEARASGNAATAASLLTRFHEPTTGDRPIGPGKKTILAGGVVGGFAVGAGLVFLLMPQGPTGAARRWNDYVNMGRRATDRLFGRRAEDVTALGNSRPLSTRVSDYQGAPLIGRRVGGTITSQPIGGRRESDIIPSQAVITYPEVDRRDGPGRRSKDQE